MSETAESGSALLLLVQLHGASNVDRSGRDSTELEAHIEFSGSPHVEHKTGTAKASIRAGAPLFSPKWGHFCVFHVAASERRRVARRSTLSVTIVEHSPFATVCRADVPINAPRELGEKCDSSAKLIVPSSDLDFDSSSSDSESAEEDGSAGGGVKVRVSTMWFTLDFIEELTAHPGSEALALGERSASPEQVRFCFILFQEF